jgi:hypothetical protein
MNRHPISGNLAPTTEDNPPQRLEPAISASNARRIAVVQTGPRPSELAYPITGKAGCYFHPRQPAGGISHRLRAKVNIMSKILTMPGDGVTALVFGADL